MLKVKLTQQATCCSHFVPLPTKAKHQVCEVTQKRETVYTIASCARDWSCCTTVTKLVLKLNQGQVKMQFKVVVYRIDMKTSWHRLQVGVYLIFDFLTSSITY